MVKKMNDENVKRVVYYPSDEEMETIIKTIKDVTMIIGERMKHKEMLIFFLGNFIEGTESALKENGIFYEFGELKDGKN